MERQNPHAVPVVSWKLLTRQRLPRQPFHWFKRRVQKVQNRKTMLLKWN